MDFAGGFILDGPLGRVASTNITPDAPGISHYDTTPFAQAMHTGFVQARRINRTMPWNSHRGPSLGDCDSAWPKLLS
jgi:hypothetical protein